MKTPDDSELKIGQPLEMKFLSEDGGVSGMFEGMAASFNGVDSQGDRILPGAFADSIAKHLSAKTRPALLWNHSPGEPVGSLVSMHEDANGLQVRGKLNLETDGGRKAHEHLKAGDVSGLSIGYQVPPGGAEHLKGGLRILKQVHLHEVSVVTMPADSRARILGVKMLGSKAELERGLRGEIPLNLARGAAARIAAAGWPALVGAVDEPDPALAVAALAEKNAMKQLAAKIAAATVEIKSLQIGKRNVRS